MTSPHELVQFLSGNWDNRRHQRGYQFGQLGRWRVGWTWYVAAGLVFPALIFAVAGLYQLLPGAGPLPIQPISFASLLVTVIVMTISVLGEEIGWRGFALPRMQFKWTALQASLILGTIHTLWHLPFWTVLGELERFGWRYWLMSCAWIIALTIYITWLMNNTGNSLPMVILTHWSLNVVTAGYLPITTVVPAYGIFIALAWAIALGLLRIYGTKRLVRANAAERAIAS